MAGALAFYAVSHALGYLGALVAAWVFMWIVLAAVSAWVRGGLLHLYEWMVPGTLCGGWQRRRVLSGLRHLD